MIVKLVLTVALLLLPPLVLRLLGKPRSGSFLGMPYSYELPTPGRVRQTIWNRSSDRLLAPHVYGWGYSLNVHELGRRLGLVGR